MRPCLLLRPLPLAAGGARRCPRRLAPAPRPAPTHRAPARPAAGELPPALGKLTALRILNLRGNQLNGTVPYQWSALANLEQLILSRNNVTGPLPKFLKSFPRLK